MFTLHIIGLALEYFRILVMFYSMVTFSYAILVQVKLHCTGYKFGITTLALNYRAHRVVSSSRTSVPVKLGLFNAKICNENGRRYIQRLIYQLNEQDLLCHST